VLPRSARARWAGMSVGIASGPNLLRLSVIAVAFPPSAVVVTGRSGSARPGHPGSSLPVSASRRDRPARLLTGPPPRDLPRRYRRPLAGRTPVPLRVS
jgi:hypothetical protein